MVGLAKKVRRKNLPRIDRPSRDRYVLFRAPSLGLPDVTLEKNMSFAFEPMAHILDFGTAVIEDTVLITEGGAESLTPYEIVHW